MPTQTITKTTYRITSNGASDLESLLISVDISKGPSALSGATEAQILGFVRNYLQSLTANPINVSREQVIITEGL